MFIFLPELNSYEGIFYFTGIQCRAISLRMCGEHIGADIQRL